MTNFDEHEDFSELERRLADAVYGAPLPDTDLLRHYLSAHDLTIPLWVIAVRGATVADLFAGLTEHRFLPLRLHAGIEYLCFNGPTGPVAERLASANLLSGTFTECRELTAWHRHIQHTISTLREKEIEILYHPGKEPPDLNAQVQAQRLALLSVRGELEGGSDDWWEPVRLWLCIVLIRHRRKLNNTRRRLLELLVDALRDLDDDPDIAFGFLRAVERIYSVYTYTDIEPMFKAVLTDIRPHLLLLRETGGRFGQTDHLSPPVRDALQFLWLHFQEDIGLAEVADAACVTPAHLARLFRRQTARTVTEHLHHLRIGHAKLLLTDTDDPLPTVAAESGFLSVKHFHHVFRRLTGTTPAAFRQQYRRLPRR